MKPLTTVRDLHDYLRDHEDEPIFFQDPNGELFKVNLSHIKFCNAYTTIKSKAVSEYILGEKELLVIGNCVVVTVTKNNWEKDRPGKAWEKQ